MTKRFQLENGLTVLIKEMHHAPVASFWVWYRVGSGDERPGITGISHWVEHMLFKGTDRFPKGEIDRQIARSGGGLNGMTWIDYTTYYELLPAHEIELAFQIEADRMVNSIFDPQEVEVERTVIISERQGRENDPHFMLNELVTAAAFRVHPYHSTTLGDMCDLQTITRADLWERYRTYYRPNNAVAVLVGDVDQQESLDKIEAYFGGIAAGPELPDLRRPEPEQTGERRVTHEGQGGVPSLQVAYHAPPGTDDDFFATLIMDAVLTGPAAMASSGGGGTNRSSRLYQALVETELATSISSSLEFARDPFLYDLSATVCNGSTLQDVEDALLSELDAVSENSITVDELEKAIKQSKAQFAYALEESTNQAYWLGWTELLDSYTWFERYIERLSAVTIEDVQRVAQRYLRPANRTVGLYVPG
jgi:zinc protease